MPVTRAMSRQTKDDTLLSNASTCPVSEAKPTKAPRSKAKTPASAITSTSKPPPKKEKVASKPKAKIKKGATGRKRGKLQKETVEEEDEQEECPKPGQTDETQETQHNGVNGPGEHNRASLSKQDVESVRSAALDDPDEMLDSFQRASKQGVRFAPSPGTSTIQEDPDLEEEEELKEEKRIEAERRAELRNQLQKFGAKFNPAGAVVTRAKEISAAGMNTLKSITASLEARYKVTKKQLDPKEAKMPNTPLMKTLTSRVGGVKRPHSPPHEGIFDDESPIGIVGPANKLLSSVPNSTSTPLPPVPESFDFQNMEPKQAQKKLILDSQCTLHKKPTTEIEITCSPAKKPKTFDLTDDLDDDDARMHSEPEIKSPVREVEVQNDEQEVTDQKALESAEILPAGEMPPAPAGSAPAESKAALTTAREESKDKSADDSIIFYEEVVKVPKKVHISAPEKHKHQHQGPLLKHKPEPPGKIKALISQFSKVEVKNHTGECDKLIPKAKEVLPAQPAQDKTKAPTPAPASPVKQQSKADDATFLVSSPNESFHDAYATFTTTHPNTAAIPTASAVNEDSISMPPPSIMNETVVLSKSSKTKTPDSKDSYNITLYEDFDEENKHRENKKIPAWASNKDHLHRELLLMGPPYQKFIAQTIVKRDPIFPFQRPNFKLFPEAVPKIKK